MKNINIIKKATLLSLVLSTAAYADIHDRIEYKLNRVLKDVDIIINGNTGNCTPINQLEIDQAGGSFLITESGEYCVTENVTGFIVVDADCVCIDLNCHTINAGGEPNAIIGGGHTGLRVSNGCITNSADAAILLTDYESVEVANLHVHDYLMNGVLVTDSSDVSVHDVNFSNDGAGERALWFDTVNNITVNRVNASGFLSTIGAIVQLDSCSAASVQDVDVTNCTKTADADVIEFDPATAFVSVNNSTGVDFVHVKVNNNTFDNNVPVSDQANHWRTAEAIFFIFCNNCSLRQCQTSNNTDIVGSTVDSNQDVEDFMTMLLACTNCIVTEHQSNTNTCTQLITYFMAIAALDSSGMVFEGCQANNNLVDELVVTTFESTFRGFGIGRYAGSPLSRNNVLRNCQANFNTLTKGGVGRITGRVGSLAGIVARADRGGGLVIDNCQANHNTIGDSQPFTICVGVSVTLVDNTTVSSSTADSNSGGAVSIGFVLIQATNFAGNGLGYNPKILNCSASSNGNYGISIGSPFSLTLAAADIEIVDCVCNRNGSASGPAAGINFVPVGGGAKNVLIKNCQIYDTGTAVSTSSVGISAINARNVVIEDTNVFNTTADGEGHGILFDTLTNSKIIRTQVHGNQNSGVELVGDNTDVAIIESVAMNNDIGFDFTQTSTATCCLVQDSRALSNTTSGFVHATTPLSTTFIGNEAQCNGGGTTAENFDISGGTISLYELAWDTGFMCNISGEPTISRWTNVSGVPALTCIIV